MKEFEELLDEVLREDVQVEPRSGMERRILMGVNAEGSRAVVRRRWLRLWWVPAGACLGLVLVMQHGRRERVDSRDGGVTVANAHPAVATELKKMPLSQEMKRRGASRVAGRSSGSRIERTEEVAKSHLPKMETFPAVAQSGGFLSEPQQGDGGRDGLRVVVESPQVAKALQELKAEQERPLQVSAIEIQPL
jgi:hypothetical protein